jgi:hypothetical protein
MNNRVSVPIDANTTLRSDNPRCPLAFRSADESDCAHLEPEWTSNVPYYVFMKERHACGNGGATVIVPPQPTDEEFEALAHDTPSTLNAGFPDTIPTIVLVEVSTANSPSVDTVNVAQADLLNIPTRIGGLLTPEFNSPTQETTIEQKEPNEPVDNVEPSLLACCSPLPVVKLPPPVPSTESSPPRLVSPPDASQSSPVALPYRGTHNYGNGNNAWQIVQDKGKGKAQAHAVQSDAVTQPRGSSTVTTHSRSDKGKARANFIQFDMIAENTHSPDGLRSPPLSEGGFKVPDPDDDFWLPVFPQVNRTSGNGEGPSGTRPSDTCLGTYRSKMLRTDTSIDVSKPFTTALFPIVATAKTTDSNSGTSQGDCSHTSFSPRSALASHDTTPSRAVKTGSRAWKKLQNKLKREMELTPSIIALLKNNSGALSKGTRIDEFSSVVAPQLQSDTISSTKSGSGNDRKRRLRNNKKRSNGRSDGVGSSTTVDPIPRQPGVEQDGEKVIEASCEAKFATPDSPPSSISSAEATTSVDSGRSSPSSSPTQSGPTSTPASSVTGEENADSYPILADSPKTDDEVVCPDEFELPRNLFGLLDEDVIHTNSNITTFTSHVHESNADEKLSTPETPKQKVLSTPSTPITAIPDRPLTPTTTIRDPLSTYAHRILYDPLGFVPFYLGPVARAQIHNALVASLKRDDAFVDPPTPDPPKSSDCETIASPLAPANQHTHTDLLDEVTLTVAPEER